MELDPLRKRTWAEIDLDLIRDNYEVVRRKVNRGVKVCCVIKANAYGYGAVKLAELYEHAGADYFAVSNIEEAIQLRQAGIVIPILILGYTDPMNAEVLCRNDITQCVFSKEYGQALSECAVKQNVRVRIHIKLDTGMGRLGFACLNEIKDEIDDISFTCNLPGIQYEGIFTHFSSADEGSNGEKFTKRQFLCFMNVIEALEKKGIVFSIRHCANSAAIFEYPEMHLDMVRAGIVLYGLLPSKKLKENICVKQALTLYTVIAHVKGIKKGCSISYGREYTADCDMKVATIPIGYADGLWRSNFKKNMNVEVEGKRAPIIGRICMDQCMIDITKVSEAKIGSVVTVYGVNKECSIDNVATINDTIGYEVLCAIGERVPRVYRTGDQITSITDKIV